MLFSKTSYVNSSEEEKYNGAGKVVERVDLQVCVCMHCTCIILKVSECIA